MDLSKIPLAVDTEAEDFPNFCFMGETLRGSLRRRWAEMTREERTLVLQSFLASLYSYDPKFVETWAPSATEEKRFFPTCAFGLHSLLCGGWSPFKN